MTTKKNKKSWKISSTLLEGDECICRKTKKQEGDIMKQVTVNDLYKYCENAIRNGHGDKNIVISDDNEGNGFHGLFYSFTIVDNYSSTLIYDSKTSSAHDTIILG